MSQIFVLSRSLLGPGICSVLEQVTDWEIVHLPTQNPEAIADLAQLTRPEVTIVDTTDSDVFHLFEQISRQHIKSLGMLVVITAVARDEETLFRLALWGAAAYLSSTISLEDFITAIDCVSTGMYLLSEECLDPVTTCLPRQCMSRALGKDITASLPGLFAQSGGDSQCSALEVDATASQLTTRETEVLKGVANGMSNKEIARALQITERTVKNHLMACFKKLDVRDRTAAVVAAFRRGWIEFPAISCFAEVTLAPVA